MPPTLGGAPTRGIVCKPLAYPEADARVSFRLTAPGLDSNEHGIAPTM
jgi:hypothetical protein